MDRNIKKVSDIESLFEIPSSTFKPQNGRIFCIARTSGYVQTESGLSIVKGGMVEVDGQKGVLEYKRYFVAEVSDDITIDQLNVIENKKKRKIRIGDEVIPFYPPKLTGFDFPTIFDWNKAVEFVMFHFTEIAGTSKLVPQEVKE